MTTNTLAQVVDLGEYRRRRAAVPEVETRSTRNDVAATGQVIAFPAHRCYQPTLERHFEGVESGLEQIRAARQALRALTEESRRACTAGALALADLAQIAPTVEVPKNASARVSRGVHAGARGEAK